MSGGARPSRRSGGLSAVASGAQRCAVLGSPVRHSLSPALHRAAYAELGLDWVYEAHEMSEDGLPGFLDSLDGRWRGLSLTMPLKRTVVPLLDAMTERAEQALAANTVVLERGRRTGHNTDVPGVAAALRERWGGPLRRALVVGGGATAASAVLGLADLGCPRVTLLVRDPARAATTVAVAARHPAAPTLDVLSLASLGRGAGDDRDRGAGEPASAAGLPEVDVLVSTIPAAAQDERVLAAAEAATVVFEVVYDPWPTPLARFAEESGRVLVSGLDLLVHQAVRQLELMTGVEPGPLTTMRAAGERELAARRLGQEPPSPAGPTPPRASSTAPGVRPRRPPPSH